MKKNVLLQIAIVSLFIIVGVMFFISNSKSNESTTTYTKGRYQLISGNYIDRGGKEVPGIFRIDTETGVTYYYDGIFNKWNKIEE